MGGSEKALHAYYTFCLFNALCLFIVLVAGVIRVGRKGKMIPTKNRSRKFTNLFFLKYLILPFRIRIRPSLHHREVAASPTCTWPRWPQSLDRV